MNSSRRSWLIAGGVCGALVAGLCVVVQSSYRDRRPAELTEAGVDLPVHRLINTNERKSFVGSEACLPCHQSLRMQTTSRHARTLSRVKGASFQKLFDRKAQF